jgi:hypothetical protein
VSTYTQPDNTGSVFRNPKREHDDAPNARGKALIGGAWYWVSAWTRTLARNGEKYQALRFEKMPRHQAVRQNVGAGRGNFGDEREAAESFNGRRP